MAKKRGIYVNVDGKKLWELIHKIANNNETKIQKISEVIGISYKSLWQYCNNGKIPEVKYLLLQLIAKDKWIDFNL